MMSLIILQIIKGGAIMDDKNEELSMVLGTVVPIAVVGLLGLVLYAFLPFWLFIATLVVIAVVAAIPKSRNAVINSLKSPPDSASTATTSEPLDKKS
jgi:hypothetical protein